MLLDVQNIDAYYGNSHILQNVSLNIRQGEVVCLLGRNGMGKSTTLKAIIGLVKPKAGQVIYSGKDLTGLPPYKIARSGIGYVPEERRIFPNLTVYENLVMGIKSSKSRNNQEDSAWNLERIVKHFPFIRERRNQKGGNLSGGEQQMLTIGRALMGNPELLLVDEPTEGLAPLLVNEVKEVLAEINKTGISILLVEHNLKVAKSIANRIYLMGKAHIGFEGSVQEFEANPGIRKKYLEV